MKAIYPENFKITKKTEGSAGYQIFVHSFRDSNHDGIGDLRGIIEAMPYLASLGVTYLWLTPIFQSASYHHYDTEDYYKIDPSFGTDEDFDELIKLAHENGLKIILDFVINHTSFRHPWYLQSEKDYKNNYHGEDSKIDYYCWTKKMQNAYSYDPVADAWAEGRFSGWMPDLNLDSPSLRKEIANILTYWLKRGVDGYRLDAVRYCYFEEREKTVEFLRFMKEVCQKEKKDCYIVGEAWEDYPDEQSILDYASSGVNMFAFPLCLSREDGPGAAVNFKKAWKNYPYRMVKEIEELKRVSHGEARPALFISNHDTDRWSEVVATRRKDQKELFFVAMALLLWSPGTPWLYYGEELGLIGIRDYKGPMSDAARRTAMPWKDGILCSNPEGYVAPLYPSSVEEEEENPNSLLNYVRKLLQIRNENNNFFEKGEWSVIPLPEELSEKIMLIRMDFAGETRYILHSKASEEVSFELPFSYQEYFALSYGNKLPAFKDKKVTIAPYSSILFRP